MLKAGLFVLISGIAVAGFAQIDPARRIATVNGEEIKGDEYYHRMEFLPGVGKRMGTSFAEFPPGFLTLEQLITEHLVLQLAKEKGVLPTDPEVQADLNEKLQDEPRLIEEWMADGKTRAELDYQIKVDLAQFKIQTAGVTITDQEIDAYYKDAVTRFTIPKRYKLRTIAVTSEEGKTSVDADLAAGKNFGDVATAKSDDVSKVNGGSFDPIPLLAIPDEATRNAIAATKIGQTTAWLKQGDKAWAKFLVEGILPEELQKLTPSLRRALRRQLMLQRGRTKNDVTKDMNEMRAKAKINIEQKPFADAYAKFTEAYLKQQAGKPGG